jgi:hypothetical protein
MRRSRLRAPHMKERVTVGLHSRWASLTIEGYCQNRSRFSRPQLLSLGPLPFHGEVPEISCPLRF